VDCIHHWKLASPNGPTVHGICKRCGAERDFPTASDAVVWQDSDTRAEVIRVVWD
jgi:hypothetical protein